MRKRNAFKVTTQMVADAFTVGFNAAKDRKSGDLPEYLTGAHLRRLANAWRNGYQEGSLNG